MVFHLLEKIHNSLYKKPFDLNNKKHTQKFNELISKKNGSRIASEETDKKKWVIKYLTQIKTDLLAKGLNLSITSKALLNKDIIAVIGF